MLQRATRIARNSVYLGILASISLVSGGLTSAFAADDPTGDWQVEDGVAVIRVAECNGSMWGAVVWEKIPGGIDKNNPDATKRTRPTLGIPTLIDMKKDAKSNKWAGIVYNAKDGKNYKSTIELTSPNELEIEGCVLGILCGGQTWTRVGPPIPSSPSNSLAATPAGPKADPKSATAAAVSKAAPAPKPTAPGPAPKAATPAPAAKSAAAVQKPAAAQPPTDTVGDICLLPDIARLAH